MKTPGVVSGLRAAAVATVCAILSPALSHGAWKTQSVDKGSSRGQWMATATDRAGRMHIAYRDGSGNLFHARWDGSTWQKTSVERNLSGGLVKNLGVGLAVDKNGNAHISYYDNRSIYDSNGYFVEYRGDLKYARWDGGRWIKKTLVKEHDAGEYNSLALDSQGRPHICFYFQNLSGANVWFGRLDYIRWDGKAWVREVIDQTGSTDGANPGEYCRIVIDRKDIPRVVYRISTSVNYTYNNHVRYAVRGPSGWNVEAVNDQAPGGGPSLALAPDGTPHLAIYDSNQRSLRYMARNASGWTGGIVDSGFDAGRYQSIAVDRNGAPGIFYSDENYKLRFARLTAGVWRKAAVSADMILDVSAQFDRNDIPICAYYSPSKALVTARLLAPEIAVFQPKTTSLVDGVSKKSFGTAKAGSAGASKTFTIRNVGAVQLKNLAVRKTGANKNDFVVGALKTSTLAPGASTTISVTFKPKAKGVRMTTLLIDSNDADENPFDIQLTGQGS